MRPPVSRLASSAVTAALPLVLLACGSADAARSQTDSATVAETERAATCPAGTDTSLRVPAGFCAVVFADSVPGARHLVVASNGDVFVQQLVRRPQLAQGVARRGILALRDVNGDHRADSTARAADANGTGVGLRGEWLYADDGARIIRYRLPAGSLTTTGEPQVIVQDLPMGGHDAHPFVFGGSGTMYVNIGSRTNSCQQQDRQNESPGIDPCTELETRAGIWRFRADATGQQPSLATRFATGNRNALGLAIHPASGVLYATQHGRDQLHQNWPALFTALQNAENPAEELQQVQQGDDFGWPYCYYSTEHDRRVLAPEYGGTGSEVGRCASKEAPVVAFPGHWAPNALLFYTGSQFPARYRGGAFVAFHGSWNRAPEPQAGYNVAFVPAGNGGLADRYEVFAQGFAGGTMQPGSAEHRPTGLAQGPDGALYVSDDRGGRIWKIIYVGAP